jgi:hypothetical protein
MSELDYYVVAVECINGTTIQPCEDGKVSLADAQKKAAWLEEIGYDTPRIGRVVFD